MHVADQCNVFARELAASETRPGLDLRIGKPLRAGVELEEGPPDVGEELGELGADEAFGGNAGLALGRLQVLAKRAAVTLRLRQFQGMAGER